MDPPPCTAAAVRCYPSLPASSCLHAGCWGGEDVSHGPAIMQQPGGDQPANVPPPPLALARTGSCGPLNAGARGQGPGFLSLALDFSELTGVHGMARASHSACARKQGWQL